jgi:hypothetical protein
VLVEYTRRFAAGVDDFAKLCEQSRCLKRELPVMFVDIEHAPLRSCIRRGVRFVDRRGNSVDVKNTGQHQATKAGADDRDWSIHIASFTNQCAAAR